MKTTTNEAVPAEVAIAGSMGWGVGKPGLSWVLSRGPVVVTQSPDGRKWTRRLYNGSLAARRLDKTLSTRHFKSLSEALAYREENFPSWMNEDGELI